MKGSSVQFVQRWNRLVIVVVLCSMASACVVRPLGWGHRYGASHHAERDHERHGGDGDRYDRHYRRP